MPLEIEQPDELLTAKDAAEILGVIPRRVRQFIKEGRLPASKAGRPWFIKRSDLDEFMKINRPSGNKTGKPRFPTPESIAKRKAKAKRKKAREKAKAKKKK